MRYGLGIDVGTSFASAAIGRTDRVEVVTLGDREAALPSLVHVAEDGTVTTGLAAARRAGDDRSRTVREVRRRIGDDTPILVAGTPYPPHLLVAEQLRHLAELVVERQGSPPETVVVTHPASWGPFKIERLEQAIEVAGLPRAELVTESLAAATDHLAAPATGDDGLATGSRMLVCDLGGTSFSTEVVQRGLERAVPVGPAATIDRLGGADFDQAVFDHVRAAVAGAIDELDRDDPVVVAALHRLRQACTMAKESLSERTEADIPVSLPGLETVVRLTRTEFEAAIRPTVANAVAQARRTITESGIDPDDLDRVILVGGSANVPLVREMLAGDLGLPVVVDDHPRFASARGAARLAAPTEATAHASAAPSAAFPGRITDSTASTASTDPSMPALAAAPTPLADATDRTDASTTTLIPIAPAPADAAAARHSRPAVVGRTRAPVMAAVIAVVLLVTGGAAAAGFGTGMLGSGGGGTSAGSETNLEPVSTSSPTVSSTTTSSSTSTSAADTSEPVTSTATTATTRPPATAHHTTTTGHHTTTTDHSSTTHHTTTTTEHHTTTTEGTTTETTVDETTTSDPGPTLTISPQPSTTGTFITLIGPTIPPGP